MHRLAILAWHPLAAVERLLLGVGGVAQKASHLCHIPRCFRPDHLVVERYLPNGRRKACLKAGLCVCVMPPHVSTLMLEGHSANERRKACLRAGHCVCGAANASVLLF